MKLGSWESECVKLKKQNFLTFEGAKLQQISQKGKIIQIKMK